MTQTYRTDDFARWGAGQGFNLSPQQVDINFWDLIQRMIAQEARPDPSAGIAYFEIVGVMMFVHMTDGSVLGPYELPIATFRDRGPWTPSTVYSKMDTFNINGGLYVVIFDHTSGTTFNPGANDGAGHDYYQLMMQTPGSSLPAGGAVGMSLLKATTTDYSVLWGQPDASAVSFTPATGSSLTAFNVADALEEAALSGGDTAAEIPYTPATGSGLTATNVQDAIDELASGGGGGGGASKQTMWIPATAMTPRITNGPAANIIEISGNHSVFRTLDFDPNTVQYAEFDVAMPKSWDCLRVTFKVFWSHATTTTNFNVAWVVDSISIPPSATLSTNFGPGAEVFVTGGAVDTLYVSAESDPQQIINTGGDPALYGDMVKFRVWRNATLSLQDNLAINSRLHGIQLYYTTTTGTDA